MVHSDRLSKVQPLNHPHWRILSYPWWLPLPLQLRQKSTLPIEQDGPTPMIYTAVTKPLLAWTWEEVPHWWMLQSVPLLSSPTAELFASPILLQSVWPRILKPHLLRDHQRHRRWRCVRGQALPVQRWRRPPYSFSTLAFHRWRTYSSCSRPN